MWSAVVQGERLGDGGQCDELVFIVEAETDVGSTGPSTNTTGGFPKGTVCSMQQYYTLATIDWLF